MRNLINSVHFSELLNNFINFINSTYFLPLDMTQCLEVCLRFKNIRFVGVTIWHCCFVSIYYYRLLLILTTSAFMEDIFNPLENLVRQNVYREDCVSNARWWFFLILFFDRMNNLQSRNYQRWNLEYSADCIYQCP